MRCFLFSCICASGSHLHVSSSLLILFFFSYKIIISEIPNDTALPTVSTVSKGIWTQSRASHHRNAATAGKFDFNLFRLPPTFPL